MSDLLLRIDVSVIIRRGSQVLLMQRPANDKNFPLHWGIPGGGFEARDSTLESAGIREAHEEVGVNITNLRLAANNYVFRTNILFVVFIADFDGGDIRINPKEVAQADWFRLEQLGDRQFTPKYLYFFNPSFFSSFFCKGSFPDMES